MQTHCAQYSYSVLVVQAMHQLEGSHPGPSPLASAPRGTRSFRSQPRLPLRYLVDPPDGLTLDTLLLDRGAELN